jgi:hypothetical protein
MSSLQQQVAALTDAVKNASAAMRDSLARIHELETGLSRMASAHENLVSDTEGKYPPPDSGCIDCTVGTVPDRLNTGPCAYHSAKRLLGHV